MGKISAFKVNHCSLIHPVAFGFQAFTLLDNIILNAASKNTHRNPSAFQTGIGTACHASLETGAYFLSEKFLLWILLPLCRVLTERVISLSQVNDLLNYQAFRQSCNSGLYTSHFFTINYTLSPSEACLSGHTSWNLVCVAWLSLLTCERWQSKNNFQFE